MPTRKNWIELLIVKSREDNATNLTVNNTNSTPISMAGGVTPTNTWHAPSFSGTGGAGGFQVAQLSRTVENLTLISTATTAQAVPTTVRMVLDEYTSTGTSTLNTDIKAYASRDGGTTYTQITLASQGTIETNHRLLSGTVDVSGQPSGSSMRYKITTHNQSDTKVTNIYGTSLTWQ